jgi:FlaA1/EpsC-like NDP-sugar epimerase
LHAVQLELFGEGQLVHERTILADIRDRRRLSALFGEARPDLVFHAAAHKHLSILERYPSEAVRTNVIGTENVIRAAQECGAQRLIFVSTDKAANPTSILGATKRLGEMLVQRGSTADLATASVRFGNVLGSRGSFLHTLDHQIRSGLPVTITDPYAERFFMSIPEAAALVVEASVGANQGETYLLDMGEPVKIIELVRRYASANDLPYPPMEFTGMCSGEKVSETLVDNSEVRFDTRHERIWRVPDLGERRLSARLMRQLYVLAISGDEDAVRAAIWECLHAPDPRLSEFSEESALR